MIYVYVRSTPHPVPVTTRIITFLVGNPYKPSFATVTGWGVDPSYIYIYIWAFPKIGEPHQNGSFIITRKPGKPVKMDDLGVPLFLETPIYR